MVLANANIPRVSIEVQTGIFTGKTTKLFFFSLQLN